MRWLSPKRPFIWLVAASVIMLLVALSMRGADPVIVSHVTGPGVVTQQPAFSAPVTVKAAWLQTTGNLHVLAEPDGAYRGFVGGRIFRNFAGNELRMELNSFATDPETGKFAGDIKAYSKLNTFLFLSTSQKHLSFTGDASGIYLDEPMLIDFETSYFVQALSFLVTNITIALVLCASYWAIWFLYMLLRGRIAITVKPA